MRQRLCVRLGALVHHDSRPARMLRAEYLFDMATFYAVY